MEAAYLRRCLNRNVIFPLYCLGFFYFIYWFLFRIYINDIGILDSCLRMSKCSQSLRRFPEKLKVKFSMCLTKHHVVKMYAGVGVYIHIFVTGDYFYLIRLHDQFHVSYPHHLIRLCHIICEKYT